MTYRATLNGRVIAEASDDAVKHIEGNVYFPPEAVNRELLQDSDSHTRCYWKGKASYFHVATGDTFAADAAFYYPAPWPLARGVKDYVAFWREVEVAKR